MKKIICCLLSVVFAFTLFACGNNGENNSNTKKELTNLTVADGYDRYDVGESLPDPTVGFGAQIDTDVYMPWNHLTAEEEAMLEQRIKDMNLQFTRIKFFPEFFERANDNDDPEVFDYDAEGVDFECVEMQALYKILDICEKYHINVDLSWYGCYAWFKSYDGKYTDGTWMGYRADDIGGDKIKNQWVVGPKETADFHGYAEYAENIYVLLDYLINTKKYTCIYGFSVIAEMFINSSGAIVWDEYVKCCKLIDARLRKEGIRDKVTFIGHSNAGYNPKYFKAEQEPLKDVFDILGTGNYNWDNNDPIEAAENYFEDIMAVCKGFGKSFYISEFCQGKHFIDAVNKTDIDDYDAGLYIARIVLASTEKGVTALNHYILGDTFFTNSYVHTMGLWQYRDNNWKAHPEYYFYGLICKYSDIGSYVYPIESQDDKVIMTAYKLPDGSWSYMCVNNDTVSKKVGIVYGGIDRADSMNVYRITEASIPEDRAVVLPSAYTSVNTSGGIAYVTLPAKSFTVLSDKAE